MLVSIVMAVYNGEKHLNESINSLLSQTYSNIEIIIVDDGSTDETQSILNKLKDKRIKVIHLKENSGAAHALNRGIKNAKGSWIAINDADDISYPNRIEEQVNYLKENPDLVGIGTLVEFISESPKLSKKDLKIGQSRKNYFCTREQIREQMIYGSPVIHSSMLFSKDIFWEVGGYNSEYKISYDHDLWLKFLEKGDVEKVPKILLKYRINEDSLAHRDYSVTTNEIQLTSSKAIYRLVKQNGQNNPKVIIAGLSKICENYQAFISPLSGLAVDGVIDINQDWENAVKETMKKIKKGKVDALIVLGRDENKNLLKYVQKAGLVLNKNVFYVFAIEPNTDIFKT